MPRHLWLRCGPFKRTSPAPAVSGKLRVHALEGRTMSSARYAVRSRGSHSLALSLPTGLAGAYAGSWEVTRSGYSTSLSKFWALHRKPSTPSPGRGTKQSSGFCPHKWPEPTGTSVCLPRTKAPASLHVCFVQTSLRHLTVAGVRGGNGGIAAKKAKRDLGRKRACFALKR